MGLISGLLTLPLAPARGVSWVVQQVAVETERQYNDTAPIQRELSALERDLLEGRIDEDEFDEREDELLDQLERLRPPPSPGNWPSAEPGDGDEAYDHR